MAIGAYKVLGKVTVPTPGTPVALYNGTDRYANAVVIQARPTNAGKVYVGDQSLNKSAENYGAGLTAGQSMTIGVGGSSNGVNPATIYVDADTANDGVLVSVIQS